MALPAHRVIGHKEYGNTGPGGWPGRKTDPVYDMNWRRARVANFVPRNAQEVVEDMPVTPHEMEMIARQTVDRTIVNDRNGNPVPLWRAVGETYTAVQSGAAGGGVSKQQLDDLKGFITSEINRAFVEFREAVAEGYEVKLDRKDGGAPDPS